MPSSQRRTLGIAIALLALLGAALGTIAYRRFQQRSLRRLAEQLAGNARAQAWSVVEGKLKTIEGQALSAAQLPQIRGQVATFDAATLKDGFRNEPWWQPFRTDFSVYGLSLDTDQLDVVEGMELPGLDAAAVVSSARAHRQASALVRAGPRQWPYAVGAGVVDTPGRSVPAVIVLAQALDQAFAQDLAARTGGAVSISDGRTSLLSAGLEKDQRNLKSIVGREGMGLVAAEDGSWAASPTPLLPGLLLWTYASLGAQAADYARDESAFRLALWLGALLIAGIALSQGLRRPALPAPVAAVAGMTDPGGDATTPVAVAMLGASGGSGPRALLEDDGGSAESATAVRKAPPKPLPANVFGRYVLLDRLGEGGMAEVYTAVTYGAEGFSRKFVVKRLRPELARNGDVVAAFIDEANLASSLVHTNIVPVFDFGKVGDEYYMAQEYILGRDLGRVNRRAMEQEHKPLPLPQVFYAAHETLKALDYAHNRIGPDGNPVGLVHRDVSPNNILVSARGEVKLFDFGIAKAQGRITQTQFGTVKGNVRFMSPEQARGEPVDSRSDLFAVGLVIYYALAGESLYGGDTAYNLLIRAAQGPGDKERASLAALPKEAQRILERALAPDLAARFQTAGEFAQALAPFIVGAHDGLSRSMERLFGEDVKAEEARFAAAAAGGVVLSPARSGATPAQGTQLFAQLPPGKS